MSRLASAILVMLTVGCGGTDPSAADLSASSSLPADVRRGLNTDPAVLACSDALRGQPIPLRSEWFSLHFFDSTGDQPDGLLVDATEPCLQAEHGRLWLYARTGAGFRLVKRLDQEPDTASAWRKALNEGRSPLVVEAGDQAQWTAVAAQWRGTWVPKSAVFYTLEPMVIGSATVRVADCAEMAVRVLDASAERALIELAGDGSCATLAQTDRVFEWRFGDSRCELSMTTYATAAAARTESLSSWGLFVRPSCP